MSEIKEIIAGSIEAMIREVGIDPPEGEDADQPVKYAVLAQPGPLHDVEFYCDAKDTMTVAETMAAAYGVPLRLVE